MNVAVINAKDLFKYIFKILFFIVLIFFLGKLIKGISLKKEKDNISQAINLETEKLTKSTHFECLKFILPLIDYEHEKENKINSSDILKIGSVFFNDKILENAELNINKDEIIQQDEVKIQTNNSIELPENVTVEAVSQNNITPKVTSEYEGVQINNQSDYQLTEEILNPDMEINDKKNIIIYHTHTCESYTPSERI